MPAEMTLNGSNPAAYGLECPEHPDATRYNLTQAHATNAVAKHNRDHHAEPEVNLSAMLDVLLEAVNFTAAETPLQSAQALYGHHLAIQALEALTGRTGQEAVTLAETWHLSAHVAPC